LRHELEFDPLTALFEVPESAEPGHMPLASFRPKEKAQPMGRALIFLFTLYIYYINSNRVKESLFP